MNHTLVRLNYDFLCGKMENEGIIEEFHREKITLVYKLVTVCKLNRWYIV